MLTRRGLLSGVAAGSIAAIASARNRGAAQADSGSGLGFACGDVTADSALASFYKYREGFDVFLKLDNSAAAVFLKTLPGGGVEVFSKSFLKEWTPLTSIFLKIDNLDGTVGSMNFDSAGAKFFLKIADETVVSATFESSLDGFLKIAIEEGGTSD